jgi:mono/diheme cytochrome c family protein
MTISKFVWVSVVLMLSAVVMGAQQQPEKVIKHVPVQATAPNSGVDMYKAYCAACHGVSGKGNGPAASALKTPPTDLTALTKNSGGKFPDLKVAATIRGEANLPAHGTQEMPIWGQLFWGLSHGHEGEVQQRVANLTKYIESIQAK